MATVLSSKHKSGENDAVGPGASSYCKLTIRVEPAGGPTFEATTDAWLIIPPQEGHVVAVLYDPSDHDKIVIDHSDAAQSAAFRERTRRRTALPFVDPKQADKKKKLLD